MRDHLVLIYVDVTRKPVNLPKLLIYDQLTQHMFKTLSAIVGRGGAKSKLAIKGKPNLASCSLSCLTCS